MGNRSGQMVPNMMVNGSKIKRTAMANWYMLTEMYMRDSGKMIKLMGRVVISMLTELPTSVNGKMINNMVKELRHGLMVPSTRDLILKVKNMEKEH